MTFLVNLRCMLGPDELFFIDVTASTHWASESVEVCGPRRYFTPANNQAMGWAIPAAIGAKRVRFDREVVAVTGDGCFLMTAIEMSTAARAGLPVRFFVFDDGAYHYMQMLQEPQFRRTTATELARIDYGGIRAGRRPRLQRDPPERRHRQRDRPGPGLSGADPDARRHQLRGPRDALAERGQGGVHQADAGRPEGPERRRGSRRGR